VIGGRRAVADAGREDHAQVDGDDGRQRNALGLDAVVDLAVDRQHFTRGIPFDLGREAGLRPAEQTGDALTHLVALVVLRELAGDDHVDAFLLRDLGDDLGDRLGVERSIVCIDDDSAVGAHGQELRHVLSLLLRANRQHDDLGQRFGFVGVVLRQPQCGLDRVFVECVRDPLHRGKVESTSGELEALVGIRDPLDGH
jgi:hypothetical protein